MELDYRAIGKRIKIARIKADLTQEALAEKASLSTTHMSNIETGNIQDLVSDCDEYEIRMIADFVRAAKETIRKNAKLKE